MSIGNLSLSVNVVMLSYLIRYDSLLQNATAILLQNVAEVYYKMCQVFYYKMRQFYYKMRQLLQNATFITNCDSTFCYILTNQPRTFQSCCSTGIGLCNFYRLTVKVLKAYFTRQEPNSIMYRDDKKCSIQSFREEFLKELSEKNFLQDQFNLS